MSYHDVYMFGHSPAHSASPVFADWQKNAALHDGIKRAGEDHGRPTFNEN